MEKMKIKGYNIKLYDIEDKFLGTINDNQLKNKIYFSENINNGQGELSLEFDLNNFNIRDDIYKVKVFYVIEIDNQQSEEHLYTGILDNIIKTKGKYGELIYKFVGLSILYKNTRNFKIVDNNYSDYLEYVYTEENLNMFFIRDFIFSSIGFTYIKTSGIADNGDKLIGDETGVESMVIYNNTDSGEDILGIYGQKGKYNINETLSVYRWNLTTSQYEDTGTDISFLEYIEGENYNNYHLDLDDISNIFDNGLINIEVNNLYNIDLLNKLIELNKGYYFFIDKFGKIIFKEINSNNISKTLLFDKEIVKLEKKIELGEIINKIYLKAGDGNVYTGLDKISIEKYGKKELYIEDQSIQNEDTALKKIEKILEKKKDPVEEIKVVCNLSSYIRTIEYLSWSDMVNNWNNYNISWTELKKILPGGSIFNINIGDKINIRNIDQNKELTDLTVVRKEFNGDYLTIYLNNYKNNFSKNLNDKLK